MSSSKDNDYPDILIFRGVNYVRVSDSSKLRTLHDIHVTIARVGVVLSDDDDKNAESLGDGGRAVVDEHHVRVRLNAMTIAAAEIRFDDPEPTAPPPWIPGQA